MLLRNRPQPHSSPDPSEWVSLRAFDRWDARRRWEVAIRTV